MDLIHVTVSGGGKPYSGTGGHSLNGHITTERGSKGVLVKNGDVPLDRVCVSQGGFKIVIREMKRDNKNQRIFPFNHRQDIKIIEDKKRIRHSKFYL